MKKYISLFLALCITGLFVFTSCEKEEAAAPLPEHTAIQDLPSFEAAAAHLADVLRMAAEHQWAQQSDEIIRLIQKEEPLSPSQTETLEAALGVSLGEFRQQMEDLSVSVHTYVHELTALGLTAEEQSVAIREAMAQSAAVGSVLDEASRCFLQDVCFIIGEIVIFIFREFICQVFCEEEVLPLYVFFYDLCTSFPC